MVQANARCAGQQTATIVARIAVGLEDSIGRVQAEFRRRIKSAKDLKAKKYKFWYLQFVQLDTVRRTCKTLGSTTKIAFEKLELKEQEAYNRGLIIRKMVAERQRSGAIKEEKRPLVQVLPKDYMAYPKEVRQAVMRFIRRRTRTDRPVPSCADIGRQYIMHPDAVNRLIHDRMKSDELKKWKILVHVRKRTPLKQIVRKEKAHPRRVTKGKIMYRDGPIKVRGWARYPQTQLDRLEEIAARNIEEARAGERAILSLRKLRRMTGVTKEAIAEYLNHKMGNRWWLERKSLAQNHRLPKAEEGE